LQQYGIIENDCLNNNKQLNLRISKLENENIINIDSKIKNLLDVIDDIIKSDVIKRSFLEKILNKIIFHENRNVEFHLKFESEIGNNISMMFPAPAHKAYHRNIHS
jgi:hypothetical protein